MESSSEETNSSEKEFNGKKSDGEKPDVDYRIMCSTCSFKNTFFTSVTSAVMPGFEEEKVLNFAHVNMIIFTSNVKAVE